ncbi:hypothetical protein SMD44_p10201 (plasmid) [Streptomyces alboflavus]|uniref:ATPase AAA-type core domain-containing protein n=1 Tax=Streptomyces alboflavus TaxID=67267 RepID=A0A291W329_9ACTN|nr:ATP-binding protein [Streptomyces alboflavus]ATM24700.1 hypothetical protein SMD44_p10201 [Streptomyces alboflavus]
MPHSVVSTTPFESIGPGTHLVAFRVTNVGSVRRTEELDLTVSEAQAEGTFPVPAASNTRAVAAVAALFGANASGTSTLLRAMADMRTAVVTSCARPIAGATRAHRPFALSPNDRDAPSSYEIELVREGEQWTYGFSVSSRGVEREWLSCLTQDAGLRTWIDRDATRADRGENAYRWPSGTPDAEQLEHLGGERTLALSLGGPLQVAPFKTVFDFFRTELLLISPRDVEQQERARARLAESTVLRQQVGSLLQVADLGVDAVEVAADGSVKLAHRSAGGGSMLLDWYLESSGTRALVLVLERVLWALENGSVILIDGLGSPLHARLSEEIVRVFLSPQSNARHAQLLCTSHATALLGESAYERALEPHHVWLAERGPDGSTEVSPLSAAQPAKDEDLADSYLAGAFGSIPRLGQGQVGRAALAAHHTTAT